MHKDQGMTEIRNQYGIEREIEQWEDDERDHAVRQYLLCAQDPQNLLDHDEIEKLKESLENSDDPVERVRLRSLLTEASTPPIERVVSDFVTIASDWVERNNVTADALLAEGAHHDDLERAGLLTTSAPAPTTKKKATKKKATKKKATAKATQDDGSKNGQSDAQSEVVRHIRSKRKPFTTPQVVRATNVSRSTASKVINQLIEEGVIDEVGEEQGSGRGRSAKLYARTN